jgi:DNA-binding transcriptional LysR family regulator
MNLRNLETFVWVATLGSFTAAGDRLGATQPAISGRIAALEDDLGVRLFERVGRRVQLTPAGRDLLPRAEQMLALAADIESATGDRDTLRGAVRLGAAETLVHTWMPDLLRRLHADYPEMSVEIHVDLSVNLRAQLVARELDIAFLMGPVSEPTMQNTRLCAYEMAWAASPEFDLPAKRMTLEHLARLPVITFLRQTRPHIEIRNALSRPGLPPPRISGSSSVATMIRLAEDGAGLVAVPRVLIEEQLAAGRLRLVKTDLDVAALEFTCTFPVTPNNPKAQLIDRLAQDVARVQAGRTKRRKS